VIAWSQFAAAAPDLAAFGKQRLEKRIAYLATIRTDGSPRVHPISPFIARGRFFVYMEPTSPKGHDLRRDSRYSMHCAVEDNSGGEGEFLIRGRGEEISDAESREMAFRQAKAIGYDPKERYALFELSIEEAMATTYPDEQPKRIKWKSV
jgi:hypothetical protein